MSNVFSDLFGKATDDLEACKILLPNEKQHDNAGSHLCKATEKLFKSYLELWQIDSYAKNGKDGHNLSLLLRSLEEKTDFPKDQFTSLLKLQRYDSNAGYGYVSEERQVSLKPIIQQVEELKQVVLKKYKSTQKKKK